MKDTLASSHQNKSKQNNLNYVSMNSLNSFKKSTMSDDEEHLDINNNINVNHKNLSTHSKCETKVKRATIHLKSDWIESSQQKDQERFTGDEGFIARAEKVILGHTDRILDLIKKPLKKDHDRIQVGKNKSISLNEVFQNYIQEIIKFIFKSFTEENKLRIVFCVPSFCSDTEICSIYSDLRELSEINELQVLRADKACSLGFFLENWKKTPQKNLTENRMLVSQLYKTRNIKLNSKIEDLSVIKTDIRSMCSILDKKRIVLHIGDDSLHLFYFKLTQNELIQHKKEEITSLGINSIKEKMILLIKKYCDKEGLENSNWVRTQSEIETIIRNLFLNENFEQTDFKNISIINERTGKVHSFKMFKKSLNRFYKNYINQLEDKIKKFLKEIFFGKLLKFLENNHKLKHNKTDVSDNSQKYSNKANNFAIQGLVSQLSRTLPTQNNLLNSSLERNRDLNDSSKKKKSFFKFDKKNFSSKRSSRIVDKSPDSVLLSKYSKALKNRLSSTIKTTANLDKFSERHKSVLKSSVTPKNKHKREKSEFIFQSKQIKNSEIKNFLKDNDRISLVSQIKRNITNQEDPLQTSIMEKKQGNIEFDHDENEIKHELNKFLELLQQNFENNFQIILSGEIFKNERKQLMIKRLVRQVRKDFIETELSKLIHFKEIIMNLDKIKVQKNYLELSNQIHSQLKQDVYGFSKKQTFDDGSVILDNTFNRNLSPNAKKKNSLFGDFSTVNFSNTLKIKTQMTFNETPEMQLETQRKLMISGFNDSFYISQNKYLKTQGSCLHYLNSFSLQKRFSSLLSYNLQLCSQTVSNIGISFYDPLVKENVMAVFIEAGSAIPTKTISREFSTNAEYLKLNVIEGFNFLSSNSNSIQKFEIKLNKIISKEDSYFIKMHINKEHVIIISFFNKKKFLFEIKIFYKVNALIDRGSFMKQTKKKKSKLSMIIYFHWSEKTKNWKFLRILNQLSQLITCNMPIWMILLKSKKTCLFATLLKKISLKSYKIKNSRKSEQC